jgi:hypothetical protein
MPETILWQGLKANPTDPDALSLYADILVRREDPFGELILLQTSPRTPESPERIDAIQKITAGDIQKTLKDAEVTVSSYVGPVLDVSVKGATLEEVQALLDGRYGPWIRHVTIVDPDPAQYGPMGTRKGWFGDEARLPERAHFGLSRRSSLPGLMDVFQEYQEDLRQIDRAFSQEDPDSPMKARLKFALVEVYSRASHLSMALGCCMLGPSSIGNLGMSFFEMAMNHQPMSRDEFVDVLEYATGGTR